MTSEFRIILGGRRVALPVKMCNKYKIKIGDVVMIEDTGNGIKIVAARVVKR